jgi:hypothetical protein
MSPSLPLAANKSRLRLRVIRYQQIFHNERQFRDDEEYKRVAYPFFVLHGFFLARHQLYETERDAADGARAYKDNDCS